MSTEQLGAREIDAAQMPGEPGVWFFILADLTVFAAFFAVFLYYRGEDPELFQRSREMLAMPLGLLNTLLLLSSSWTAANGVRALREGLAASAMRNFKYTLLLGLGFVTIKCSEFTLGVLAGYTLQSNDFFMFYYTFGGIHLVHVLVGLIILLVIRTQLRTAQATGNEPRNMQRNVESGVLYWHMVDLLWVLLFAVVYLLV